MKVYQEAGGTRLFRVHAMGKVETSTNGRTWFKAPMTPKQINHWKRSGSIVRLAADALPKIDPVKGWDEEITKLETFLMEAHTLRELVPVHPTLNATYDRVNMQTVKTCPTMARGYDEWGAQQGLDVINKGLSLPAKMVYREIVVNIKLERLKATRANLLAQRAKAV